MAVLFLGQTILEKRWLSLFGDDHPRNKDGSLFLGMTILEKRWLSLPGDDHPRKKIAVFFPGITILEKRWLSFLGGWLSLKKDGSPFSGMTIPEKRWLSSFGDNHTCNSLPSPGWVSCKFRHAPDFKRPQHVLFIEPSAITKFLSHFPFSVVST